MQLTGLSPINALAFSLRKPQFGYIYQLRHKNGRPVLYSTYMKKGKQSDLKASIREALEALNYREKNIAFLLPDNRKGKKAGIFAVPYNEKNRAAIYEGSHLNPFKNIEGKEQRTKLKQGGVYIRPLKISVIKARRKRLKVLA